jgi:NADPH:quinone reductase
MQRDMRPARGDGLFRHTHPHPNLPLEGEGASSALKSLILNEFGSATALTLQECNLPNLRDQEVLIKNQATGLNFPDLLVIEGKYQVLPPLPFSPGKELAGVAASVGAQVSHVKPGDRVLALVEYGACAELVVAPATNCYPIPDAISFVDAAAMGVMYQTAHYALFERGRLQPREWVLVNGASGAVGIAALQLAKAHGAKVIAGVRGDVQAKLALYQGADHLVRLDWPDLKNSLRDQVREITNGHGTDVIIDPVGGDVFDASMRALAWCGRLVVVGFMSGRIPEVKANYLLLKNITVTGLQISDYRDRDPARFGAVQQELFSLRIAGKIKPPIVATYPMARFRDAFEHVKRSAQGKIVMTID